MKMTLGCPVAITAERGGFAVLNEHSDVSAFENDEWCLSVPTDLWATAPGNQGNWTLTDRFGRGAFPWHSDGAIARKPPRFIVLQNLTQSRVPTEIAVVPADVRDELGGVVLRAQDRRGRSRLLSALERHAGHDLLRWDARTCSVAAGPRKVEAAIASLAVNAQIDWMSPATVVIDNWQVLHRRPAVPCSDVRGLRRWYVDERRRL